MDNFSKEYLKNIPRDEALELLSKYFKFDINQDIEQIIDNITTKKDISAHNGDKCSCGSRNTVQREFQIRKSDEGATIFIICMDCNKLTRV
jgi:DNA-directed RNA polymerase subunit M/transcription elongation factor TFIIS